MKFKGDLFNFCPFTILLLNAVVTHELLLLMICKKNFVAKNNLWVIKTFIIKIETGGRSLSYSCMFSKTSSGPLMANIEPSSLFPTLSGKKGKTIHFKYEKKIK